MMNAYQRPLFRQAGGPAGIEALPPPPPAGVAALPQQDPQAMVEAAGQMASSEMESIGQNYVMEMMNSLDNAENFKTVIDALRGNKLPLDERFAELAEYVGEDDAEKTPESVLAMVQPVIMMTEEGNVDSGIGQLMQSLTGEVDMMTEEGDLTDMGQGVGSLMVANQEAPPQQFANGGAVQHFANGSGVNALGPDSLFGLLNQPDRKFSSTFDPSKIIEDAKTASQLGNRITPYTEVKDLFPQYQGMFREVLDSEGLRDQARSGIMFDIAQAGLNFAGGVDPRTGESTTGLPIASQAAVAASGLPGSISQRIASAEEASRAGDLAALQASIGQVGSERQLAQQLEAREELSLKEQYVQLITQAETLRLQGDIAAANLVSDQAIAISRILQDRYNRQFTRPGMVEALNDPENIDRYANPDLMVMVDGEETYPNLNMSQYERAGAEVHGRRSFNPLSGQFEEGVPVDPMTRESALQREFKLKRMAEEKVIELLLSGGLPVMDEDNNLIDVSTFFTSDGQVDEAKREDFDVVVESYRKQNPVYTVPFFFTGAQGQMPAPGVTPNSFQDGGEVVVQNFQDGSTPEGVKPLVIPSGTFRSDDLTARENLPPPSITVVPGTDLSSGVGTPAALMTRVVDPIWQAFSSVISEGEQLGDQYDVAVQTIRRLNEEVRKMELEQLPGRQAIDVRLLTSEAAIEPARFTRAQEYTIAKLDSNIRNFSGRIREQQEVQDDPLQGSEARAKARRNILQLQRFLSEYYNLHDIFQQSRGIGMTETPISDDPEAEDIGRRFFTPNTPENQE